MKRTMLKIGNVLTYTMMGASALYGVSALLYGVLPVDITQPVIDTLNMNAGAIIPAGISSGVVATALAMLKIGGKTLNEKLHQSNVSLQLWEQEVTTRLNQRIQLQDNVNDAVVLRVNEVVNIMQKVTEQQRALMEINAITAQRNIMASDELVPPEIKTAYQKVLSSIQTLDTNIKPIVKIVEETIIKEVEKQTTDSKVSW